MNGLLNFILKYDRYVFLIIVIITVIMFIPFTGLKINPDVTKYFPENDEVVKLFNYIGENFGGGSMAMIAVETDEVFNKRTIELINYLTCEFKKVEGVSSVISLTNVMDIKKIQDGIEISKLIGEETIGLSDSDLEKLKIYVLSKKKYTGRIISKDSKITLIICKISEGYDKVSTVIKLKEIIKNKNLNDIYYGGLPFQILEITNFILKDLKTLTPLAGFLILSVLFISFRSLDGVFFTIICVFISIVWTMGIMGLLKIQLTIISDAIPVILLTVGSAYGIHVVNKIYEEKFIKKENNYIFYGVLRISTPVILSSVTTIAGFFSLVFGSYLKMIKEFGIFTSIGVFFAMLLSLIFIPVLFSLKKSCSTNLYGLNKQENNIFNTILKISENLSLRYPSFVLIIAGIIIVIFISGIPLIKRQADLLGYFREGSKIRLNEKIIETKFGGSTPVQVLVKGDLQEPYVLNKIIELENLMEKECQLHNITSIADIIMEMNDLIGEGNKIPDSKDKIQNLWFLLEGEDSISQLVNSERTEALVTGMADKIDSDLLWKSLRKINNFIDRNNSDKLKFYLTGAGSIYEHIDSAILKNQIQSLLLAIVLVFICMIFMLRSIKISCIGIIPIIFTLSIVFGFMGYIKIPLNIATALVAGVAIGTGIDYPVHLLNRYRFEIKNVKSFDIAIHNTLMCSGRSILTNVLSVAIGFLVLVFGSIVPLAQFGILVSLTTLGSGFATLFVLPAVLKKVKFYSM